MIPDSLKVKMDHLRFYFSHINPDMTYLNLIEHLTERALLRIEHKNSKGQKFLDEAEKNNSGNSSEPSGSVNRVKEPLRSSQTQQNIPSVLRHAIWLRDGGVCSFKDPHTGKICGGRYQVQVDHIHPRMAGGEHKLENLQLLCADHNRKKGGRVSVFKR
jgi:hypothetical protein